MEGITVIPHARAESMRYRHPATAEMGARILLFLRAGAGCGSSDALRIEGKTAEEWLNSKGWYWHNTPSAWPPAAREIPLDARVVWQWNQVNWIPGEEKEIVYGSAREKDPLFHTRLPLPKQKVWISALTFSNQTEEIYPDTMLLYVANESGQAVQLSSLRLLLPESGDSWRYLFPKKEFSFLPPDPNRRDILLFPAAGWIPPQEKGGIRIQTGPLPLTYGAIELRLRDQEGKKFSVWAHQRIKKEVFDISGGWVADSAGSRNILASIPFLKTLRRMYVNTAHIGEIPGYTDQTGPDGLYSLYPLKYFNRLLPLEKYDNEKMLPRIHAVECLGEPQYGGGRPVPPQEVWKALQPYAGSRLATTLTNSEERIWRGYMGLSDYPHYDAYRVTAPSPDSWRAYDRWAGEKVSWGAPLETIGDMCRSLREMSRPAPTAYWSQGPHQGWDAIGGRKRTSPTPDEIRLQAYHALASRITSLYWFNLSLKSILKFPDTLEELTRIGREIRLLEDFYLQGDAYQFQHLQQNGKPDWDLSSILSPQGALLFALDLDYTPDRLEKVFRFKAPRAAVFEYSLPGFLQKPMDIFRVDADGIHEAQSEVTPKGVKIRDVQNKVAVYVAAASLELRPKLEKKWRALLQWENSFRFDPSKNEADLQLLRAISKEKSSLSVTAHDH